jgi:hypothetical protein
VSAPCVAKAAAAVGWVFWAALVRAVAEQDRTVADAQPMADLAQLDGRLGQR